MKELIKTDDGKWVWHRHETTTIAATAVDYSANTNSIIRKYRLWCNYGTYGGLNSLPLLELEDVAQAFIVSQPRFNGSSHLSGPSFIIQNNRPLEDQKDKPRIQGGGSLFICSVLAPVL